jgi:hypothetical protein
MSKLVRKRDRFLTLLGRKDPPTAPSALAPSATGASSASGTNTSTRCTEVLASIRTVLNVAEKVLEGCPISWPKAAVGAAAESLKAVQVRVLSVLRVYVTDCGTDIRGERGGYHRCRRGGAEDSAYAFTVGAHLAADGVSWAQGPNFGTRLVSGLSDLIDMSLMSCRELEKIRAGTTKWSKQERHIMKRLLDAERVAGELKTVMGKIHEANERFLVCSLMSFMQGLC